jgi:uncharacterized RDD family membrane protein YckC
MTDDRFAAPRAPLDDVTAEGAPVEYVGFWARALASLIDTVLALIVLIPVSQFFVGARRHHESLTSVTLDYIVPAIIVLVFWFSRSATPGKMAISAVIVDADTLGPPTPAQFVIRYVGYYVSSIGLLLGFVWVGIDARKQGWHDKMASTLVIRRRR